MTVREALKTVDLDAVYGIIHDREQTMVAECDRPTLEEVMTTYSHVVKELLGKPKVKAYYMPLVVDDAVDPIDNTPYIDVYLRNRRYVKPPKNSTPWGGYGPKGTYNANLCKYNERYSLMGIPWSRLIDTSVEVKSKGSLENAMAHLLWHLTFDGWTEKKSLANTAKISKRIIEATKEIKAGKCITLPPTKNSGMKVIMPDSVSKKILDFVNQPLLPPPSTKCGTCSGFGLWASDDATPMGRMDASDGMPTKACPECGANPNPIE